SPFLARRPASVARIRRRNQLCPQSAAMHDTRRWTMVVRLPPASASQASADHTDQRVELFDAHPAGRDEEDPQQNGPADQDGGEGSRDALADRLADAVTGSAAEQGG